MKRIVTIGTIGLVFVGLFAACSRQEKSRRKSTRGESCARTDDCEADLRCVNLVCVGDKGAARAYRERPAAQAPVELPGPSEEALAAPGDAGDAGVEWVYSKPANLDFTRSEVTVEQYRLCVRAGRCTAPDTGDRHCNWGKRDRALHPANCIDWSQAKAACEFLGGRLPTEDEWFEEASNGGRWDWPWGESPEASCDSVIWGDGSNTAGCGRDSTWPVCSKPRGNSVSGLCDMSGNVWEWTATDSDMGTKALRGGSWYGDNLDSLRVSYRNRLAPSVRYGSNGVRCVRSPQIKPPAEPAPKAKGRAPVRRSDLPGRDNARTRANRQGSE